MAVTLVIEWHPRWPDDWAAPKREKGAEALLERIKTGRFFVGQHELRVVAVDTAYHLGRNEKSDSRDKLILTVEI